MKRFLTIILNILLIIGFALKINGNQKPDMINKIRISNKDIPSGFVYGRVPGFARRVLKDNPWLLDRMAIKKLARRIYPGGDYNRISKIHMTVVADKRNPYGDDIVCYIILYKDNRSAREEINKITSHAELNRDRVILIAKDNFVIYLHVDDVTNFHYIRDIAENMKSRIAKLKT